MNGLGMIASRMQALQERAEKAEAKAQEQAAAIARVEALAHDAELAPRGEIAPVRGIATLVRAALAGERP